MYFMNLMCARGFLWFSSQLFFMLFVVALKNLVSCSWACEFCEPAEITRNRIRTLIKLVSISMGLLSKLSLLIFLTLLHISFSWTWIFRFFLFEIVDRFSLWQKYELANWVIELSVHSKLFSILWSLYDIFGLLEIWWFQEFISLFID